MTLEKMTERLRGGPPKRTLAILHTKKVQVHILCASQRGLQVYVEKERRMFQFQNCPNVTMGKLGVGQWDYTQTDRQTERAIRQTNPSTFQRESL